MINQTGDKMNTLLTTILVLTFLGILAGLFFCIWVAYKVATYTPNTVDTEVKTCKYKSLSGWEYSTYKTECGKEFYDSTESSVITDWMTYCPYCGGRVE